MKNDFLSSLAKKRTVRALLLTVAAIAVLFMGYQVYLNMKFRVVGTNPDTSSVAYYAPFFNVEFNRELTKEGLSVGSKDDIIISSTVKGKILRIDLKSMDPDQEFTITIRSITSTDGEKITNKSFTFTAKRLDSQKIPKDQLDALLEEQDDKPEPLRDPILDRLPYSTLNYTLTAEVGNDNHLAIHAEILLSAGDIRGTDKDQVVEYYKNQIVETVKSWGVDPAKYNILYTIVEPSIY